MKRTLMPVVSCFLVFQGTIVFAREPTSDWQLWTVTTSESYTEPVSVYAAFHDLEGDFTRGDEAYSHDQVEIGASRGRFSLALIARYDFNVKAHADTIELAHAGRNDLPVEIGREYKLNASVNHISSAGLRLDYLYQPTKHLDLVFSISMLRANNLYFGNFEGALTTGANDTYQGEATFDYSYSEDPLLNRLVPKPTGHGYAVDMSARWHASQRVRFDLTVRDWAHRIYWKEAPFTKAKITTATVKFDDNGSIETTPLLSGIEGEHDARQRLPARTNLEVGLTIGPGLELEVGAFNVDSATLPRVGFRWNSAVGKEWYLNYGTETGAITFGVIRNGLRLHLGLDRVNYQEAHFIAFGFSYFYPLKNR